MSALEHSAGPTPAAPAPPLARAAPTEWTIERVGWDDERAVALRAEMDEEIGPRYAEVYAAFDDATRAALEVDFAVDPDTIVDVVLVHDEEGVAVGHAALRALGAELEVKRVFVARRARGKGASRVLMAELERLGASRGAIRLILQTGDRQPEAIALYERLGYRPIDIYPPYVRFPASRCFGKSLVAEAPVAEALVAEEAGAATDGTVSPAAPRRRRAPSISGSA